jgi:hypothetical protein
VYKQTAEPVNRRRREYLCSLASDQLHVRPVKATVGGISPQAVHLILIEFHKTPGSSHINLLQILS